MSWTGDNFYYTDGDLAPIPLNTSLPDWYVDDIFLVFVVNGTDVPYPSTAPTLPGWDINDIWLLWKYVPESLYVPMPQIDVSVLGAFAYCTELKTITIPSTVTSLGTHTFFGSALEDVYMSRNTTYTNTTFPEDTTIHYYD